MTKNPWFDSRKSLATTTFSLIYKQLSKPLYKFIAKRIGASSHVTEEVFEETMVAAWKGFNTFKHKSSYFTWICRIALNKIADYYRGQINERSKIVAPFLEEIANIEDPNILPEEYIALQDLRVSLRNCLNLLPDKMRNLLYLRYWEEMSVKEIARTLGMGERSVEGKIYRAKQMLKSLVESEEPETAKIYNRK